MSEISLDHDGGKYPENGRRLRGKPQQRQRQAEQHSEDPDDEAEEVSRRAWGVRSRTTQKLTRTASTISGTGFAARALSINPTLASRARVGRHRHDGEHEIEHQGS